jgi:hypothetical protein
VQISTRPCFFGVFGIGWMGCFGPKAHQTWVLAGLDLGPSGARGLVEIGDTTFPFGPQKDGKRMEKGSLIL